MVIDERGLEELFLIDDYRHDCCGSLLEDGDVQRKMREREKGGEQLRMKNTQMPRTFWMQWILRYRCWNGPDELGTTSEAMWIALRSNLYNLCKCVCCEWLNL
jgi:hypothetical protein